MHIVLLCGYFEEIWAIRTQLLYPVINKHPNAYNISNKSRENTAVVVVVGCVCVLVGGHVEFAHGPVPQSPLLARWNKHIAVSV